MFFQIEYYYGASINGQAIYCMKNSFTDCTKFPQTLEEKFCKEFIIERIKKDGFDPNDFEIGFLTKEQYENRLDKETEKSTTIKIENDKNNTNNMNILKALATRIKNKKLAETQQQSLKKPCCVTCKYLQEFDSYGGYVAYDCFLKELGFNNDEDNLYSYICANYKPCKKYKKYLKEIAK